MKKITVLLSFFLLSISLVRAQSTYEGANPEKRSVGSFHGIEVATGIKLVLTASNTEEIAVSAATTEFRANLITEVKDGILKIYYKEKDEFLRKSKERKELKVWVSYKTLDKLYATTGAQVEWEGTVKTNGLDMKANTGATIKGRIDVSELNVTQNTGSQITLSGTAQKFEMDASTGSQFKGIDLVTNNCEIETSTGAGIYITVQKELNVKANTGGYVKYKGEADKREIRKNTGGTVTKI